MNLRDYGAPFFTLLGIVVLLVVSPALSRLLAVPRTEFFSEFWVLDSNHKAKDYPRNITDDQNYTVFLGIGNRMGYCAYYLVEVKFRNDSQPAPSWLSPPAGFTPSSSPSIFNITAFVADNDALELPITFLFNYTHEENLTQVILHNMVLNEADYDMTTYTIAFNTTNGGFPGHLFFELWLFNPGTLDFRYHERFVSLQLNMTA